MADENHSVAPAVDGRVPRASDRDGTDAADVEWAIEHAIGHFNERRYWYAYEFWRALLRWAPDEDRDFFEGLMLVTRGLMHLERQDADAARAELDGGIAKLLRFVPAHRGIVVAEVVDLSTRLLNDLNDGQLPHLIPPVIKFVDFVPPEAPEPSRD
jgi:hypothetical protein